MIDPLLESLLEDAMEEALADVAAEGALDASDLLEAFGEEVASDPLVQSLFERISL